MRAGAARAPRVPVPASARRVLAPLAEAARKAGTPLYAVGGPVRDWLLKRPHFDLDLTVAGDPDPVADAAAKLLGGRVEPFGRFGTRRIVAPGRWRVDIATTRAETYAEPAALPTVTAVGVPIEADLFRRDFTVNALALRLDDGSDALVDAYGGARDLKDGIVRVLHPASFRDDPTRVFRAARFLARFRYDPAPGLLDAAKDALAAGWAAKLSPARRLHELERILEEKDPNPVFALLESWGYLSLLQAGLPRLKGLPAGVTPRLAALALALGPERGRIFVDAFPHEHHRRVELHETLDLAFTDKSPRTALSPAVLAAVRRAAPKLPAAALKPCFLTGADLIAAGMKPGPSFHAVLDEAARLQRAGKLKARAAALRWLKSLFP